MPPSRNLLLHSSAFSSCVAVTFVVLLEVPNTPLQYAQLRDGRVFTRSIEKMDTVKGILSKLLQFVVTEYFFLSSLEWQKLRERRGGAPRKGRISLKGLVPNIRNFVAN